MEKLSTLIKNNPKLKSNRGEYLKLAVKEGNAVRSTGPHKLRLIGCENAINKDYQTQQPIKGVNLLFEEEGVPKKYFVPILGDDKKFHYLIEIFSEIDEGEELILEFKRREGGVKGFINVEVVSKEKVEQPIGEEEIPIIEDEEHGTSEEDIGAGYSPEI